MRVVLIIRSTLAVSPSNVDIGHLPQFVALTKVAAKQVLSLHDDGRDREAGSHAAAAADAARRSGHAVATAPVSPPTTVFPVESANLSG